MGKIQELASVQDYNEELGAPTLHPLMNVVDMSELGGIRHGLRRFGFYCVYLKHINCGPLLYGRSQYDYREGTLVFIAPGQVAGVDDDEISYGNKGWILMFHPDLLLGTPIGRKMNEYSFFAYSSNEALHMSEREEETILNSLKEMRKELENPIDKHTKQILTANIEVFLNHCVRFYDRQFITRGIANQDVLTRFEALLNDYFSSDMPRRAGLPSVAWCAEQVHLSPNYFGDLVKKETGCSAQKYIQLRIIERAKEMMFDPEMTISQIAYSLGFSYPHHLSKMFKNVVGMMPHEYRAMN